MPGQTDRQKPKGPPDPLNPMGSPIQDPGGETWQPKRGPVFKAVVWALLTLIGVLVILGLITGFLL